MNLRLAVFAPIAFLFAMGAARGQWVQSVGPKGTSVVVLSSGGGRLFVGTWARMFLSTDGGATWSADSGASCSGNVVRFGGDYFCATPLGMRKRSAEEGSRPWTESGLAGRYLSDMAASGSYLFARSGSAVFRSADGSVWDSLAIDVVGISLTALAPLGGTLAAGTSKGGIHLSADSGKTWAAGASLPSAPYITRLAAVDSAWFALAGKLIYLSLDRGGSWKPLPADTANGYPVSMVAGGADLFVGTSAGWVLRSSDHGDTWTRAQAAPSEWPIRFMAADGPDIYAATSGEVFRSPDRGKTWAPVDLRKTSLGGFAALGGDLFVAGLGTGVHRSRDNGATWTTVSRGIRTDATVYDLAVLGEYVIAATAWHIFRSGDRGATWNRFTAGLPSYPYILSLYVSGSAVYAGSDEGFFRSLDSGQTWKRFGDSTIQRLFSGPTAEMGRFMLVSSQIARSGNGGVYRSGDGGGTWTRADSGMPLLSTRALFAKDGFVFAGGSVDSLQADWPGGVYRSPDSGRTWSRKINGLADPQVRALIAAQGVLIAGTRSGAFRSLDNGDSWTAIEGGKIPPILSLTVSGNYLVAGTDNGAVWRMPLPQATSLRGYSRSRRGKAGKGRGGAEGRPYDVRGRTGSGVSARGWEIWKKPSGR